MEREMHRARASASSGGRIPTYPFMWTADVDCASRPEIRRPIPTAWRYPHQRRLRMFAIGITAPGILLALEMSSKHDEDLARRLQRRDSTAMGELYDRFGRVAYSVILAIVR